jgi:hypothetical protein
MISLDSLPIPAPDVIGQVVEHEAVLVLPERGEVKVLNESGARIWELIDGHRSISEIVALIAQEYVTEPAQVERDTLAFVQELCNRRMVSVSEPASAAVGLRI